MLRKSLADYYLILGVPPGSSPEKLKQAYRSLVRQWHPDKFTHDRRLQQTAEAKLKDINEAYTVLRGLGAYASSSFQPSNTAGQAARTYATGSSGASRTYTAGNSAAGRAYSAGSSSTGRTYTSAGNSSAGRTYTTAGNNRPGYQSTTANTGPRTTWHSAPVPPNRSKSGFLRFAPIVLFYVFLMTGNLFNSTSSHAAPAALPSTTQSTPQFTDIAPLLNNTQRALYERNWQDFFAGRKEPRIKMPAVPLSDKAIAKLQRDLFGAAAKPMTYKRVINPVNIDWPGFKVPNPPAEKQDIDVKPLSVPIVPFTRKPVIAPVNIDWPGFKVPDPPAGKQDIDVKPLPVPIVPSAPK